MERAPQALEQCKMHFQYRFLDEWRSQIKDHTHLVRFFQFQDIEVTTVEKERGWRYDIKAPYSISYRSGFESRESAEVAAFKAAFSQLELYG